MAFVGRYEHDLRNGEGTLRWPNGDVFTGTWKNGGRFGKGTFFDNATKTTVEQVWHEEEDVEYSIDIPPRIPREASVPQVDGGVDAAATSNEGKEEADD
jgi:hypothetical protein